MTLTLGILFLSWILLATAQVNFPCDQIPSDGEYSCSDVGFCYNDYVTGSCVEDTCVKMTTESDGCDSGCGMGYHDSDYDCVTQQTVNKTGFYCINSYHSMDGRFYDFLKTGNCGLGFKPVTLQGKLACIDESTPGGDYCNEFTSVQCEFYSDYCFVQNGKCVRDVCRDNSVSWSGSDCSENTTCVGKDRYQWDGTSYTSSKVCFDPNHTKYDKCMYIDIYDHVPTGVGDCEDKVLHSEWCTAYSECKVITFEDNTFCSSLDEASSSSVVRVPFFITFLVMAVLAFSFSL